MYSKIPIKTTSESQLFKKNFYIDSMCYDTAQLAYRIYRDAVRLKASPEEIDALKKKWEELKEDQPDFHHANGFDHPELIIFQKKEEGWDLTSSQWGLIPDWVHDEQKARSLWNSTLIARGESMFEKPSFEKPAKSNRCVLPVDGFYEHFHKNNKTFPHYIQRKDGKRLLIGALSNDWKHPVTGELISTFSIVTTKANDFMASIHNNPKIPEARMPLFIDEHNANDWISGSQSTVEALIQPDATQRLTSKTVKPLRGKLYIGNRPEIMEEHNYSELNDEEEQLSLF